ncbi:MAG TPA: DNA repair protein RadA, partial [Planctomycetota bacterium]|nr:DNA repair protein RadA [Planctomycetota bacterium]
MRQLKKPKTAYICQKCGAASPKWLGRCPECGKWGTIVEELVAPESNTPRQSLGQEKPISINDVKVTTSTRLTS